MMLDKKMDLDKSLDKLSDSLNNLSEKVSDFRDCLHTFSKVEEEEIVDEEEKKSYKDIKEENRNGRKKTKYETISKDRKIFQKNTER